jgi:hypothetical protein
MFRYAAPLFAGAVALGVLARADPLNVLATSREGGAWVYDNPATWLPDWGATIAPTPGIEDTRASFVVRTFCKPDAMKKNYADFWLDGEKEAYVVHHDYGSNSFFDSSNGIKMERFIVNETSGERGYRVQTDAVDFEYGFALKNLETGAWLYEIGKGSEALVYNEPCVQQYGAYFNRVRTAEPDPNDINYVFGSCDQVCADDYLDTANQVRTAFGSIPPYPDEMVVGQSDDARLFTLHSARLGNWIRSAAQRDKGFAESEDESRVIVAHVDAYGPNLRWPAGSAYLLMAQLSVRKKANGDITLSLMGLKYYDFGRQCTTTGCSAAVYDLSEKWNDPDSVDWTDSSKPGNMPREIFDPLYTLGVKGDTRVSVHEVQFEDSAYLQDVTLAEPGQWGEDMDVRRVTPVSGATVGPDWWGGKSIRNFHPMVDETATATADEKIWIFAVLGGLGCGTGGTCITMLRVKIYNDGGALKMQALGARRDVGVSQSVVSSTGGKVDVSSSLREPIGQLYNDARWILTLSSRSGQGAIGLGGFKYVLAPEMVPSLIKTAVVDMTAELGATPHPEPEIPALGQDAGDDNADYSLYPHYFTHTYPGTTGCEATCESDDIDEATCSGKFECEWYDEKCWSRVGREACPESPEALDAFLANVINPGDGAAHQVGVCSMQCEHETQNECLGDSLCIWTGGACFPEYDVPC